MYWGSYKNDIWDQGKLPSFDQILRTHQPHHKKSRFHLCMVPVGLPKNPSNFSFFLLSITTLKGAPNKSVSTDTDGISRLF